MTNSINGNFGLPSNFTPQKQTKEKVNEAIEDLWIPILNYVETNKNLFSEKNQDNSDSDNLFYKKR